MAGDNDHVTAVLLDPATLAAKWATCPDDTEADEGESEIVTLAGFGWSEMAALAVWLVFARLVAIKVTLVGALTADGAV